MKKTTAALLSVFFIVPMWMNFLLRTYAWKVLLSAFTKILYTESAVLLGMVYNFLPFMILPIYTTLIKLDKSYIEAAADLGANPTRRFSGWCSPLLSMPGIISGITMVFIPSTTTFAISQLLGGGKTMLYGDLIYMKFITEQSGTRAARYPSFSSCSCWSP
jgi:spermidine/putrescine transport system permease protein